MSEKTEGEEKGEVLGYKQGVSYKEWVKRSVGLVGALKRSQLGLEKVVGCPFTINAHV